MSQIICSSLSKPTLRNFSCHENETSAVSTPRLSRVRTAQLHNCTCLRNAANNPVRRVLVQAHHHGCDSAIGPDIRKLNVLGSGVTLNVHSLQTNPS